MNKKALFYGLLYSAVVIAFKLYIVLSGNMFSKFGFYYSIITGVFLIIPFFFLAIYQVREKDFDGSIASRDGLRIGLTVLAVGLIVTSIYNYVEFNWKADEFVKYYNSAEYLDILKIQQVKNPDKIKVEDFPRIIKEQSESLSAFRATTGKIIPLLFIGLTGAFVASIIMKREKKSAS
jgi:hypothetical protein